MNTEINLFGKKIKKETIVKLVKILSKIGLILLIGISIYILNHSVLVSPDDYNFTYVQGTNYLEKVDSLSNALQTAKFFYYNWTGRVIPHVLIGIFRNLPSIVFEISNTVVFLIFILLITKVLNNKSSFLSILAVFGYFVFSMMFGEKFAWLSGSLNYLWPSTLLVIFVYYFYNYFIGKKNLNILSKIALILYAFVVGFSHEVVSFVGGSFLLCVCFFNIKNFLKFEKNKKITIILTFLMFCLGAFATIFAPGNFIRMDSESGAGSFSWSFLQNYIDNKFILIIVLISMITVFIMENLNNIKNKKDKPFLKKLDYSLMKEEVLYFILPALIATLPMIVISYFPPRAFLAYEAMFAVVFAKNVTIIAKKIEKHNIIIVAAISIVFSLIVFGKYSPSTLAQINYIIPYKEKVTAQYEEAQASGEKDVLVSKFEYLNWIHREDYINIDNFFPEFDYHMPTNALISLYYGFDRVTAIGDDEYLIEIEVDTEGINPYNIIDKTTGENVQYLEYDEYIRYCIPKDMLGTYVLDCRDDENLYGKILNYSVRYIGGDKTEEISLDDLVITK